MDLDLTRDLAAKASAAVAAVASASLDTLRSTLTAPFASAPAHGTPLRKAHSSDADLLAHAVDSPDERRRPSSSSGGRTATDGSAPWHVRALAAARAAAPSLTDVAAMRFAYVDEDAAGPAGEAVVVVVAAHVRTAALTRREVVLLASLVADAALAGGRRYIVVVYGDGAEDMAYVYAGEFFASLHAALPPAHRTALAALYVLAPPLQLRLWLLGLRLSEPLVYSQAKVVASLAELERRFAGGRPPAPPDCAAVADAARAAAAEREGRI